MSKHASKRNSRWLIALIGLVLLLAGCHAIEREKNESFNEPTESPAPVKLSKEALTFFLKTNNMTLLDYNEATHTLKIDMTKLDFNRYDDLEKLAMLMQMIRHEMNENQLYVIGINHEPQHLNPKTFEFDLKGDRTFLIKGDHLYFEGALSHFKGVQAIYELQKHLFKANGLVVNEAGVCRLWASKSGALFLGFGAKSAPENLVTTLDGKSAFITTLSGELMDSKTLEPIDDKMLSSKNPPVLFSNGENNCAVLYYSNINVIEWLDLLNGQRILLNASVLGENIDMNSVKSVDKNKKRYMILKVNNLKSSEYVVTVPMNQEGKMETEKLTVEHSGVEGEGHDINGFVIREE